MRKINPPSLLTGILGTDLVKYSRMTEGKWGTWLRRNEVGINFSGCFLLRDPFPFRPVSLSLELFELEFFHFDDRRGWRRAHLFSIRGFRAVTGIHPISEFDTFSSLFRPIDYLISVKLVERK